MNVEQKRVAAATDVPWRAESAIPALVGRVEELEAALRTILGVIAEDLPADTMGNDEVADALADVLLDCEGHARTALASLPVREET